MSLQVELLEKSFNYIKPYGNSFVNSFFEKLFNDNPKIKSLFIDIDPETKNNIFWHALVSVIGNLRQPNVLNNLLQGFGAKLFTYGLLPKHYALVKKAFLFTFKQFLGNEWTTEIEQGWNDAYEDFRRLMSEGAEQTRKQIALNNPDVLKRQKGIFGKSKIFSQQENVLVSLKRSLEKTSDISPFKQNKHTNNDSQPQKAAIENSTSVTKTPQKIQAAAESQSASTTTVATPEVDNATKVQSLASVGTHQLEDQSTISHDDSNKNVLIGGGILGGIGILFLMILL